MTITSNSDTPSCQVLFMLVYIIYIFLFIPLSRSEEILIKDSGVGFIDEDDIAMIFYITLENRSERDFDISVFPVQCCDTMNQNEMDCYSMSLIGGDMGVLGGKFTKNVTLIYPNLYLMNRQGQCTINIRYKNEGAVRQKIARIDFTTVVPNEGTTEGCECPSIDLDQKKSCRPVDCVIKYSGMKSFFDTNRLECVYVTKCVSPPDKCVPQIGYSLPINNCTFLNRTISIDDLHLLDTNRTEMGDCTNCPLGNIICHHGSSADNVGQCECDAGWTTTTDDEIYSPSLLLYHMCNVEVGAWNCLNKGKIRTTTILIAVFAVTIASKILILMCILNWCYKRYRQKKQVICSHMLDPDREEVILCQDLDGFEKCVCIDKPEKKSHFLETQTVNVSYYPCLPSAFSSLQASVGSEEKCKCSLDTEESIELSKTTTSQHVTFESESEASMNAGQRREMEEEELSGEGEEQSDLEEALEGEGQSDVEFVDMYEDYGEQTDFTGYSRYTSRRGSTQSKSKSMSTARKSKSSATVQK